MSDKYCERKNTCRLVKHTNTQYGEVVKQNKSLQTEARALRNILREVAELVIIECSNCYVYEKECQYPKCKNTKCNIYNILEKLKEVNNGN